MTKSQIKSKLNELDRLEDDFEYLENYCDTIAVYDSDSDNTQPIRIRKTSSGEIYGKIVALVKDDLTSKINCLKSELSIDADAKMNGNQL